MTMITETEVLAMTDTELVDAWSAGNNGGDGWGPGEGEEGDISDAIEAEGGTILRTIYEGSGGASDRMYVAEFDGQFCVVADCNGAWAVTLAESDEASA